MVGDCDEEPSMARLLVVAVCLPLPVRASCQPLAAPLPATSATSAALPPKSALSPLSKIRNSCFNSFLIRFGSPFCCQNVAVPLSSPDARPGYHPTLDTLQVLPPSSSQVPARPPFCHNPARHSACFFSSSTTTVPPRYYPSASRSYPHTIFHLFPVAADSDLRSVTAPVTVSLVFFRPQTGETARDGQQFCLASPTVAQAPKPTSQHHTFTHNFFPPRFRDSRLKSFSRVCLAASIFALSTWQLCILPSSHCLISRSADSSGAACSRHPCSLSRNI